MPLIRAAIQIAACFSVYLCAPVTAALTLLTGGSLVDALQAGAFAFLQMSVWTGVSVFFDTVQGLGTAGLAAAKGAVHGVIGGALSVAQGGNFLEGFAANAIGGAAGVFADGIAGKNIVLHTAIVSAAGCASASATGGKCANGAVTAAFANLYNKFGDIHYINNRFYSEGYNGELHDATGELGAAGMSLAFAPARIAASFFIRVLGLRTTVGSLIKNSVALEKTKGRSTLFGRSGGLKQANKDFNALNPSNVKKIPNGRVGTLKDGRTVNVRGRSKDKRPTLEILKGRRSVKFRYDN